ncbi:MAG TPA: hypothetical protein VGE15_08360 [Sphingobacteriaceae bacterium]
MNRIRIVSRALHFLCKAAAILYLVTAAYALLVILLSRFAETALFRVRPEGSFTIQLPFSESPFLIGDHTAYFLIMMVVTIGLYGLFGWLLGDVFKAFSREKLFTPGNVSILTRFYRLNFYVPVSVLVFTLLFTSEVDDLILLIILHGVIGMLAWFLAAILNQGIPLQDEYDQTL